MGLGQRAVQLRRSRRAGPQADLEVFARRVQCFHALCQRLRHRLGVARASEAAHADIGPGGDEGGGGLCRHELGLVGGVLDARGRWHVKKLREKGRWAPGAPQARHLTIGLRVYPWCFLDLGQATSKKGSHRSPQYKVLNRQAACSTVSTSPRKV